MSVRRTLRTRVYLNINPVDFPDLIVRATSVHDGMAGDTTHFPAPTPTMPVFAGQIQDLRTAQQAMTTRAVGTTSTRNAKAEIVVSSLESLQSYVQQRCDATPDQALVIIEAASMKPRGPRNINKPLLAAKNGTAPGSALLSVHRAALVPVTSRKTNINWQYSLDGKTWISVLSTPYAKTEIDGLPSATTVSFRASATVGKVVGPWTQVVTLLIK
jgi:hypothetical protein